VGLACCIQLMLKVNDSVCNFSFMRRKNIMNYLTARASDIRVLCSGMQVFLRLLFFRQMLYEITYDKLS
jgi:hypothetical protein